MDGKKVLENLKYTKKHEWVRVEGDKAFFGITDFAQNALGDIVFVDMPKNGKKVKQGDSFGAIESVKAAEDLYAPVSGTVSESNPELAKDPAKINADPYGAWIASVTGITTSELDSLMGPAEYKSYIETLQES